MNLSRVRAIAMFIAVGAAFAAMTSAGDFPVWSQGLFGLLLLVALLRDGKPVPPGLQPLLMALTAGGGLVLLLGVTRGALDGVVGAASFGALLAINRALLRRSAQDDPTLVLTSVLMLAGGAALSAELTYAACFSLYAVAVTVGATFSHLERAADAAGAGPGERRALTGQGLFGRLLLLAVGSLALAGVIFVGFPRVNARYFGRAQGPGRDPMIGFGGKVQLGGHGLLRDDARPAMRVTFLDGQPRPDHLEQLWRAEALDTFDGKAWSNSSTREQRGTLPTGGTGKGLQHVRVEVLPLANTDFVFAPGQLAGFSLQRMTDTTQYVQLVRRDTGDARLRPRPAGRYSYEVWARDTAAQPDPELTDEVRARSLQLPAGLDARVAALAKSWAGTGSDTEKANRVLNRLRHDFTYSLELPGDVADPLAHFLFERKKGHCEYFSTAMVLLLRTLGVPARAVAGFSGGDRAPGSDYFVVRAGDSHTWVEASLDGQRWTTFDPTPDAAREAGPSRLAAWWSATSDELERWWQSNVVDYDLLAQFRGLKSALDTVTAAGERFRRDDPDAPGASKVPWRAIGLGAALLGLVAAARWWRLRRRGAVAPVAEEVEAMESVLALLAARGGARKGGETLREWLARLDASKHPLAENARQGVALYEQSRFAARPWGESERARIALLLGRLKRAPLPR